MTILRVIMRPANIIKVFIGIGKSFLRKIAILSNDGVQNVRVAQEAKKEMRAQSMYGQHKQPKYDEFCLSANEKSSFTTQNSAETRSILVLRLSSMGDVLLLAPFLRRLHEIFPLAHIDVCVQEEFADALSLAAPYFSKVLLYKRSWSRRALSSWKQQCTHYDLVLDLQRNRHSRRIRRGLGNVVRRINKYRWRKLALVYAPVWSRLFGIAIPHIVVRYAETAGIRLTQTVSACSLRHSPSSSIVKKIRIAVAPGAAHATKRWLPEYFAETIWLLYQQILQERPSQQEAQQHERVLEVFVCGGASDSVLSEAIRAHLGSKQQSIRAQAAKILLHDCCCRQNLSETAYILASCAVALCNDSGLMHLAAACGTPIVAVFGSTVPALGFTPLGVPYTILEASPEQVPCRPCTHIGRKRCPKRAPQEHLACMKSVTPARAASAVLAMLEMR